MQDGVSQPFPLAVRLHDAHSVATFLQPRSATVAEISRLISAVVNEFYETVAARPLLTGMVIARYAFDDMPPAGRPHGICSPDATGCFSIDNSVRIPDERSQKNLAQYIRRPTISLKKIHYEPFKGGELYHATHFE